MDVDIVKYPTRNTFLKVKPNGDVAYSERLKVNYRCGPQKNGFKTGDLEYSWAKGDESVLFDKKDTAQKYKLTEALARNETVTFVSFGDHHNLLLSVGHSTTKIAVIQQLGDKSVVRKRTAKKSMAI
ncbi:unnamed protein product, partial [Oppiella nova]